MNEMDAEAAVDPIALFRVWMKLAEESEPNDPGAVALATATRDGFPSVRMVLMKQVDQRGFSFYTNAESQKGLELAENPRAAMCFHWKSLRRQVRISGKVSELSAAEADDYFRSRSRRRRRDNCCAKVWRCIRSRRGRSESVFPYFLLARGSPLENSS